METTLGALPQYKKEYTVLVQKACVFLRDMFKRTKQLTIENL